MTGDCGVHFLYLHGFASAPLSSKGRFYAARLAAHGVALHCPDFNAPDFSTLTTSRMIAQTEDALRALGAGPAALIGSSLGAFVAWHVAARAEAGKSDLGGAWIERLVLLAPALDFGANRMRDLGEAGIARWKETGWHTFQHHAYGEPRPVHFALYEDAGQYRADLANVQVPVLVFQGTRDDVVDPEMVVAFARSRPNILLRLLDDGHQLLEHLDALWNETASFTGLHAR